MMTWNIAVVIIMIIELFIIIYYFSSFFCFNDTATTESYTYRHTLSLHDALPISVAVNLSFRRNESNTAFLSHWLTRQPPARSEEHTSELQSLMRISYAVFCLKQNNFLYGVIILIANILKRPFSNKLEANLTNSMIDLSHTFFVPLVSWDYS